MALGRNTELRRSWLLAEVRAGITQCVRRAETNDECEKVHRQTRSEQNSSSGFVRVFLNITVDKLKQEPHECPSPEGRGKACQTKSNSAWKFQQASGKERESRTWTQTHVQEKFTSSSTKTPGVCSERHNSPERGFCPCWGDPGADGSRAGEITSPT